ncbi:MAG: tetratricopeptide repeat protein, partial [Bacteroidales bacterium]|nr:tetratricopeptide repeat protein [Bacteroidales bacterium]
MNWRNINLQITKKQKKQLLKNRNQITDFLENKLTINFKPKDIDDLFLLMSDVVSKNDEIQEAIELSETTENHVVVNLLHEDDEILNLPWRATKDRVGKPLENYSQLFQVKSLPGHFFEKGIFPARPFPLKILVVISSPENAKSTNRLSYEDEELMLLKAFDPLMTKGLVEIDFADDASLETLEEKITLNKYHILHFSGHSYFDEDKQSGFLLMEDNIEMNMKNVRAKKFAETVNCSPANKIPLVVISSCQSAQGNAKDGLGGITGQLMRVGVPAVVSMGLSITDKYAMLFTAELYRKIAEGKNLHRAFKAAVNYIKTAEYEEYVSKMLHRPALQWTIPNIYVSQAFEQLIDRDAPYEELDLGTNRYLFFEEKILLEHDSEYVFVGRRKDRRRIFKHLLDKTPVLLTGQGGVGKTAMAEHLVQRYIIRNPKTEVFAFSEKDNSAESILSRLKAFLIEKGNFSFLNYYEKISKPEEKVIYLATQINNNYAMPLFVFDNLEDFQESPGKAFKQEYARWEDIISFLIKITRFPLILTTRYPLQIKNGNKIKEFDLNTVNFADYWRKALYLKNISKSCENSGQSFYETVQFLFGTFGGNYRALEFFDKLITEQKQEKIIPELKAFKEQTRGKTNDVLQEMSKNLLFEKLVHLLDDTELNVLHLLSFFNTPVTEMSLVLQGINKNKTSTLIEQLKKLTLIEKQTDIETGFFLVYVTPLIKGLLTNLIDRKTTVDFSHENAGRYYIYVFNNNINKEINQLEQAFEHFYKAGNKKQITKLGEQLSKFYYANNLFREALFFATKSFDFLKEDCPSNILNRIGLIYKTFGKYDISLRFYQLNLKKYHEIGDKSGEALTLNNISQIYDARGDYKTALKYLEQSLQISQQISDKSGESTTLSNISQIYHNRGDYESALKYLEQSLQISHEIGDKSGEGTTLNNISQIYHDRGDYKTALKYLEQSLQISQEIGDKSNEGITLSNISQIFYARGDYETALKYLEQSLQIIQEIGDKSGEGTTLNNIGQIYSDRGDYETALKYLGQSLQIRKEIGDKSGEGTTLNNISQIYHDRGDYKTALKYLEQSLQI